MIGLGPLLLPPNRFDHFYRGGSRITALRGPTDEPTSDRRPEEWVACDAAEAPW